MRRRGLMAGVLTRATIRSAVVWPILAALMLVVDTRIASAVLVTAHGALCDGVADDTTAIQNAYAAIPATGGELEFPAGVCRVIASNTALESHWNQVPDTRTTHPAVVLTKSKVRIVGAGSGSTVLKLVASPDNTRFSYVFANAKAVALTDIAFEGFAIDLDMTGNPITAQPRGILVLSATRVRFDDVRFFSSSAKGATAARS